MAERRHVCKSPPRFSASRHSTQLGLAGEPSSSSEVAVIQALQEPIDLAAVGRPSSVLESSGAPHERPMPLASPWLYPVNTSTNLEAGPSTEIIPPSEVSSSALSHFRGYHPPAVWEHQKEEIRRLYIEEDLPLRVVRAVMAQRGFVATEKMFKYKFAAWGIAKNNRKSDAAGMAQVRRQRKVVDESRKSHRRGKIVDLNAHWERVSLSRLSWDEILRANDAGELPQYLRPRTPPPMWLPRNMRSPDFYHIRDLILRCFRELKARSRNSYGHLDVPLHIKYGHTGFYKAVRTLRDASWLFLEGRSKAALQLSDQAFASLHLIVTDPSELALHDILGYQVSWMRFGHHDHLWKYISDYAYVVAGPTPWLREVFVSIDTCIRNHSVETCADLISTTLGDAEGIILGNTPDEMRLGLQAYLITFGREHYAPPSLINYVRRSGEQMIGKMRSLLPANDELLQAYDILGFCTRTGWQDNGIPQLAKDLHDNARDPFVKRVCLRVIYRFHRTRWECDPSKDNPRLELAISSLRQVIHLSGTSDFPIHREIWEDIKLLESWHKDAGEFHKAQELEQHRNESLQRHLATLSLT